MSAYNTVAVVGGDLRQAHIANCLAAEGKTVYALLLENNTMLRTELAYGAEPEKILPKCDVVIFPMPFSLDEWHVNAPFSDSKVKVIDCVSAMKPGTCVFGGKLSKELLKLLKDKGIYAVDYLKREELAVKNAMITAEGALAIAMEELPTSIFESRCLITGHGRIAKCLMRTLCAMGAQVTVAARKPGDLAEIRAEGCRGIHIRTLEDHMQDADIIFNTVPSKIFGKKQLAKLRSSALLIDLASRPGGIDLDAAKQLNVSTIWALSLPGKVAPISAAEIILDTIKNCLQEKGGRK